MYASSRDIARGTAEMLRPPRRVLVSDGAQALHIVNPSGAGGSWSPEVAPYMVKPLNMTASRLKEAVVFVGPARSGKTVALIDGRLAYTITCNPADTLIIQTSKEQAEDFSKTRITRAIRQSPELLSRLSPRAHDDNVLLKFFRSGMSLRFGWPSLSVLSGKDIHDVLMTDVDNITGDLSIDEAFGLALKRIQTYMSAGILVAESSPARDYTDARWKGKTPHEGPPASGISSLYNRGDRHRWYWPCPSCKEYFQAAPGIDGFQLPPMDELLERVRVDDTLAMAKRYALLFCTHCHEGLEHRWKKAMNAKGDWVADGQVIRADGNIEGEAIESRTASYWLGGVSAAYQSWESLIERYLQALKAYALTGNEKPLKTTTNVDQALPYVPMAARSDGDPSEMQGRAEPWPRDTVPEGVRFLTAVTDVQGNRFVNLVLGWGPSEDGGLQRWVVDWFTLKTSQRPDGSGGFLPLDPPTYLEDWERLIGKVIQRRYPLSDGSGRSMPIRYTGIDWGGKAGTSSRALEFWRSLAKRKLGWCVRLVKGEKGKSVALCRETYPDARKRKDRKPGSVGDVPQLLLNVDRIKDTVAANVARTEPGPGYHHFPQWLPTSFYDELTAESRTPDGWKNLANRRNEAFDLCVYSEGLSLWQRFGAINWSRPPAWAAPWDTNPDVITDLDVPPPSTPRAMPAPARKSWVNREKSWIKR